MKLDPTERCYRCGYDIRGIDDPTCPECGASVRYRPQEFLTGLVEETRGGGRRFCLTCQRVAEFSDEGVCPLCGGRVSRPAGDA
ncbi:MAG: hypothetical protein JJU33_06555 [Phycisphaerales bacterium]|nr:hypothetical protein [Phycisphaerales bacterium]